MTTFVRSESSTAFSTLSFSHRDGLKLKVLVYKPLLEDSHHVIDGLGAKIKYAQ